MCDCKPARLDRRAFLGGIAATGTLAMATPAMVARADERAPAFRPRGPGQDEVAEASITELGGRMAAGATTAVALTRTYLSRIESIDRSGPTLRSVIEVNPDAEAIAAELDRERAAGNVRGPLHGIPVLVKDNLDSGDRMETSAGSLALLGGRPTRDSEVVARLRAAGAILLGKTNLSEWANIRSEHSSSGWSGRGGQTKNPYVLDRNPCGSSSGSGAAIAASLAAAAIGTETNGSIVCPSNANGLVGIKPTLGLVSRRGIVPIAHSQDTAGPMARTVTDALLILAAIVGADPEDAITTTARSVDLDPAKVLDPKALAGARLGVARNYLGFHPKVDAVFEQSLAALRAAGAEIVDPIDLATPREYGGDSYTVLLYELKADLAAYLATRPAGVKVRTLADVIAFNDAHADAEMPIFGQDIFLLAESKGPLTDQAYLDALAKAKRLAGPEGIDRVCSEHQLDAIIAMTGGPAWVTDWVNGDHFGGGCSSPAAVAGYPHVTVPAGFVHGLPVGLSFFGPAFTDARQISLAYAFETATTARRAPGYLPHVAI
jgi:amidase